MTSYILCREIFLIFMLYLIDLLQQLMQMAREYFAIYAETCFASFGDRVKHWITINEPLQTAVNGFGAGIFAPGRHQKESVEPFLAAHYQILSHAAAVDVYRRKFKVFTYIFFFSAIVLSYFFLNVLQTCSYC